MCNGLRYQLEILHVHQYIYSNCDHNPICWNKQFFRIEDGDRCPIPKQAHISGTVRDSWIKYDLHKMTQIYITPDAAKFSIAVAAAVFSERELTYTFAIIMLSVICNVRASYSAGWIFWQYFYAVWTLATWPAVDIHETFYGDRLRGTPPSEGLNAKGVAKYNDSGPRRIYLGNGAR